MKTQIFESYSDFLKMSDKDVNGVSQQFAKNNPDYEKENSTNKACWDCSGCSGCSGKKGVETEIMKIPIVENIHQKVLQAVSQKGAFDMSDWHTCETTYCRGGWVVVLAGEEGKKLEKETSSIFAAMQIYKKSSSVKVYPPRFFENNETAMKDIIRCADEEKKLLNIK